MKVLFLFSLIILFSCASQGIPSGGPIDEEGPSIMGFDFIKNKTIIITFNEMVDPNSVINSLTINGEKKFKIKVKYNKVILSSLDYVDPILELNISRNVSDYQNNIMDAPVSQIFKLGLVQISDGMIDGRLLNILDDQIYELQLYGIKGNDILYVKNTQADINGHFKFKNLDEGEYRISALEGSINNFNSDYQFKRYGIQSENIFVINNEDSTFYTEVMIVDPLPRLQIIGADILNGNHALLTLSDGSEKSIYIESNKESKKYATGDSVYINTSHSNRLEDYGMDFSLIANINQDTLSPIVNNYERINDILHINFSEPVHFLKDEVFLKENKKSLKYSVLNPFYVTIDIEDLKGENIYINSKSISDFNGNSIDSLTAINIPEIQELSLKQGELKGKVNYSGKEQIVVRLRDIASENEYHTLATGSMLNFHFEYVLSGNYILDSYELKHPNIAVYYSGIWEPFKKAARFSVYSEPIDIRAHWIVEGIEINYD